MEIRKSGDGTIQGLVAETMGAPLLCVFLPSPSDYTACQRPTAVENILVSVLAVLASHALILICDIVSFFNEIDCRRPASLSHSEISAASTKAQAGGWDGGETPQRKWDAGETPQRKWDDAPTPLRDDQGGATPGRWDAPTPSIGNRRNRCRKL